MTHKERLKKIAEGYSHKERAKKIAEGYETHLYIINSVAKALLSSNIYREFVVATNNLNSNRAFRNKVFNFEQMRKNGFRRIN